MSTEKLSRPDNEGRARKAPKNRFASRLFGYDIFISFALGPPPRGTHSYASDLARRLRERDFTVFFSEDEAPPGEPLDSTLRSALQHSKTLVVIANHGTLQEPRWVREEVELFRKQHPKRPIVIINVGAALQDPQLLEDAQTWLGHQGKIWLDVSDSDVATGIASEQIVTRLVAAPTRVKSNVKWRWVTRGTLLALAALSIGLGVATKLANDSNERARAELRRAVSIRLVVEAQGMMSGARSGGDERALLQLLAAKRIAPGIEVDGGLLDAAIKKNNLIKLMTTARLVTAQAISPDGNRIVYATLDQEFDNPELRLLNVETGQTIDMPLQRVTSRPVNPGRVISLAFSPDGSRIVSSNAQATLQRWDAKTGQPIGAPMLGHMRGADVCLAFSRDGSRIVSGSEDGTLRLWNAQTGKPLGTLMQEGYKDGGVTSVAFNSTGSRIISGQTKGTLRLWNAQTLQPIGEPLQGHESTVWSVAFSPDDSRIVSGGNDSTLRLWDARTRQPIGEPLQGHKSTVWRATFSHYGTRIISMDTNGTLRLWDARNGKPIGEEESHLLGSRGDFNADGSRIVTRTTDHDGTLRLWDTRIREPLQGNIGEVLSVAFSRTRIVSVGGAGFLWLWDARTGQPIGKPIQGHKYAVLQVAFSTDGSRIVSGDVAGTLRLWDAETGQPIGKPLHAQEQVGGVRGVAFSPDGTRIVSAHSDDTLRLWDTKTHQPIGNLVRVGRSDSLRGVALSHHGTRVILIGSNETLRLWDASTGQLQPVGNQTRGHAFGVESVALSSDDSQIASGDKSGWLRIFDAKTGRLICEQWLKDDIWVNGVAFSPDGRHIVSGDSYGMLRLWDAKACKPVGASVQAHGESVTSVAFSPDGRHIVSGSTDGTVRKWPTPKAGPDELCKKLTRNMSRKQWREWVSPEIPYHEQCPGLPIPPDAPNSIKEKS